MVSQDDRNVIRLLIEKDFVTNEQIQDVLDRADVTEALKEGIPFLLILKELGYIEKIHFQQILSQHVLVQC